MTVALQPSVLFGLCGAALVGIGLFAVVSSPGLLRRIVGCNILGAGIFLVFGAVARRGAGAGFEADPVPQALVITGIVVAFSASALAVALLKRLAEPRSDA
ncbi:NADH-quinone oxidoreductase subunit K [uncultured Bosea sp.]|uniref:NADH-quinone oxidoreductase subunit K n=1 Tax=uncultured Bosea sp. TaxID=211457 RepID=UPI0025D9A193|nr:NADH-quinone oxidoreductase subunit K [uncultured Bosea sp.]